MNRYLSAFALVLALHSSEVVLSQSISIVNPGFELDSSVTSPPTGWLAGPGTMYATAGSGLSPVDPVTAHTGLRFATSNRLAPNPDQSFPSSQAMSIFQNVDLSSFENSIDAGNRFLELGFAYNSADSEDNGTVAIDFLDSSFSQLGSSLTFQTSLQPTASGAWNLASLVGTVPTGTRSLRITLTGERLSGSGSARNVSFDSFGAQLVSTPVITPRDVVYGNLIQFNDNGAWSWFQDERAIVDEQEGTLIVGSVANRDGVGGEAMDGKVRTTHFDLSSGRRTHYIHNDLESYGAGDDHNVPALLQKNDGDILTFYAAHNNLNGTEDDRSYYRTFDVGSDTWGPESEYHWWNVIPANAPGDGGTTYSNLFQLSAEDADEDGNGRLYNIARTQQSPHIMYSDDNGSTWQYGGQLTKQASNPPSDSYVNGYYKYTSNGVDRIDLFATEFHPRDFNNSIYHAYIQDGKLYDSSGSEIDDNTFDTALSFDTNKIASTDDFTQVFQAGMTSNSRGWTTDIQSYEDGTITALFKVRAGAYGAHTAGADDHRIWFARLDPVTKTWSTHEIAKAGARLFSGSETDYTGLGALHPNDPNTIYISTEIDPTTNETLAHHEIYKGVSNDHGSTWIWTAITENSSFDNLRPIVPKWDASNTAVLWWRGSMDTSHDYDTAVVGILDRNETLGSITYIDASASNTTLANDTTFVFTGPSNNAGAAEGSWHQRTGAGNNGNVFSADEIAAEDAPVIKTSVTDLDDGTYDVFAFFWSDINQDWQVQAGLAPDDLMLFRLRSSQQAEADQFEVVPLIDESGRSLYRAYLGRTDLSASQSIDVFIDDSTGSGTRSVWYDGIGYARVEPSSILGDFDRDGDVDGRDFLVWQRGYGTEFDAADLADWQSNYGMSSLAMLLSGQQSLAVPEPSSGTIYCFLTLLLCRPWGITLQ
jgi:hypothetical protein